MRKILVIRAEPAASDTVKILARNGFSPVKLPLFEVRDTGRQIVQKNFTGVVFTSRNAINTLMARGLVDTCKSLPVFCVGDQTAAIAKEAGCLEVHSAKGNAEHLVRLIAAWKPETELRLLYPTTENRSVDLALALKPHGILVDTVNVYEMQKLSVSKDNLLNAFDAVAYGAVFIYSKRSSEHLACLIETAVAELALDKISLVAISRRASSPLDQFNWKNILIADAPDETAMIAAFKP